jgi:hypothetical protein
VWVTVSDPGRLLESVCACVCVACPLLPVSVTRVSPVCPRSSAQSGWVWAHAGDACTTAFLFSSATCLLPACCLLPAACCLPAACHVLRFSTAAFSPPLVATPFPLFILHACVPPECFSAHLIFSHPPSRGRAAPNSTHSHVFSPCDSMTSSHLTSSLC